MSLKQIMLGVIVAGALTGNVQATGFADMTVKDVAKVAFREFVSFVLPVGGLTYLWVRDRIDAMRLGRVAKKAARDFISQEEVEAEVQKAETASSKRLRLYLGLLYGIILGAACERLTAKA